jgi:hypothetical protein
MKIIKIDFTVYFVNALVAILLAVIYTITASYFLPEGVNWVFVERLWKRLIILVPFIVFSLILYIYIFKSKNFTYSKSFEKINRYDWVFVAIPMIPIFRYVLANQDWLNLSNSILVLILFALTSTIFCVFIPSVLSLFAFKHLMMAVSTSLLFVTLNMVSLSAYYSWQNQGDLYIQLAVLAAIFILLVFSVLLPRQLICLIVGLIFIANVVLAYIEVDKIQDDYVEIEDLILFEKLSSMEIQRNNDILLLVYEAYGNYETMLYNGFDNNDQLSFLKDNGFHIYHGIYSLDMPSIEAMSRVFNLESSVVGREYCTGGGAVQNILHEVGYKSQCIFEFDWYIRNLRHDQILCNNFYPPLKNEALTMIKTIMRGDFNFAMVGGFTWGHDHKAYIARLREVLEGNYQSPLFLYAHSDFPGHGGWATEPDKWLNVKDWYYKDRLPTANYEMRLDVELILNNYPDAITIIAGDHGPLRHSFESIEDFTADDIDRHDIQNVFGSFLAIRWPDPEYAETHNIEILQDIFPAVFAYLYNDDDLFNNIKMERAILNSDKTLRVTVKNGIIVGGKNDSEPLFLYDGN